ncbi:hypothetical protein D3C72_2246950 [compost metagenome]
MSAPPKRSAAAECGCAKAGFAVSRSIACSGAAPGRSAAMVRAVKSSAFAKRRSSSRRGMRARYTERASSVHSNGRPAS